MIIQLRILFIALLICISSLAHAKIYQWKDANGVTQFSQTPPPVRGNKKAQKVKVVSIKSNRTAADKDGKICGYMTKERFEEDSLSLLRELRMNIKPWIRNSKVFSDDYLRLANSGHATDKGLTNLQKRIDDVNCMLSVAKKKIIKLEPLRQKYLKELAEAEKALAAYKAEEVENPDVIFTPGRTKRGNSIKRKVHKLRAKKRGLVD